MHLKFVIAGSALGLLPLAAAAQDGAGQCLGLGTAIEAATSWDPRIETSLADRDLARAGLVGANARNLPQVSLFGQSGLGGDTPPLDRRRDDQVGVQLNQELYSFGARRLGVEAARRRYESAQFGVAEAQTSVAQGIALAFLELERADRLAALAARQEEAFAEDARTAVARLARNVITLTDASQIRARHAVARSDLMTAQLTARAAAERLSLLANGDVACVDGASIEAFVGREATRVLGLAPEAAVDEAVNRSAAVNSAAQQLKAAEASVGEAARSNLPVLSANAFTLYEYDSVTEEFDEQSRFGVAVSQDLYTGGRNSARQLDAKARLRRAKADVEFEHLAIEDAVRRSLTQAKAQQEIGMTLLEAAAQARIRFDNTRKEYERGTKTLTDLVLATDDYYSAERQETTARFEFYSSLIRLYGQMGLLVGE